MVLHRCGIEDRVKREKRGESGNVPLSVLREVPLWFDRLCTISAMVCRNTPPSTKERKCLRYKVCAPALTTHPWKVAAQFFSFAFAKQIRTGQCIWPCVAEASSVSATCFIPRSPLPRLQYSIFNPHYPGLFYRDRWFITHSRPSLL